MTPKKFLSYAKAVDCAHMLETREMVEGASRDSRRGKSEIH